MIKFDFNTYTKKFISKDEFDNLYSKKDKIIELLHNSDMNGWTKMIDEETINNVKKRANYVKKHFDCLVVVGIGGSYLGSFAFHSLFQKYFKDEHYEVIYTGTTLSSKYLDELVDYLNDKNFCLNAISKSGKTLETVITYQLLKKVLMRKYPDSWREHIIITTGKNDGFLYHEVEENHFLSFELPNNIGGRYSFITPAHLFPLALNYSIDEIVDGYYDGKRLIDVAYQYAVIRRLLFDKNKLIEDFCVYEENMLPFTEWLKQLFGETEGKNNMGIYPTSTLYTRDLHSLGQFIQEGNKILFETLIRVNRVDNYIEYNGNNLDDFKHMVSDSVVSAHYNGGVPNLEIKLDGLNVESVSSLIYFFMLSAAFSGYLFGVEPFNQPGVEIYKEEIRKSMNGEL